MGRLIEVDVDKLKELLYDSKIELTNNIISIVRENYIPKDQYEARLKADMVAMLEEIELELDEARLSSCDICIGNEYQNLIQQKINALRGYEK